MKNKYILLLIISFCFSYENTWSTTRFEHWWNSKINKSLFRDPVSFIPYKVKLGYYQYGGLEFWNNIIDQADSLTLSPIITTNGKEFDFINDLEYRQGISFEIDFLAYNFFKKLQNSIDITIGVGYKLRKPKSKVLIPYDENNPENNWFEDNSKIFFNPVIHGLNINTNFIVQLSPNFYSYYNFSYGSIETYLFENSEGDLSIKGEGYARGHAIGFNFVSPVKNKNYDLHYGLELRFDELIINEITDLTAHISKVKIQEIGLNFNIGIGYGGKNTIGDKAYNQMINSNYIEAIENFNFFKSDYPEHPRHKLADKMIDFSKDRIAYQMFYNGLDAYNNGNIDQALIWYKKALKKAENNRELKSEIDSRKYLIASQLLKDLNNYQSIHSDEETIEYLNYIISLSNRIEYKATSKKIDLLNKKADFLVNNKDYKSAYEIYFNNKQIFPDKAYISNGKINIIISYLINDINKAIKNKDYILAFENMNFLNSIYAAGSNYIESNIKILKEKLDKERSERIGKISLEIINEFKDKFSPINTTSKIIIGDYYSKINKLLGEPVNMKKRIFLDNEYLMALYSINKKNYRLYFKDNILFELEEIK